MVKLNRCMGREFPADLLSRSDFSHRMQNVSIWMWAHYLPDRPTDSDPDPRTICSIRKAPHFHVIRKLSK